MNQKEIENRLDILHLVLQYSSQKSPVLTTGERIVINQERGALFRYMEDETVDLEPYKVSSLIEGKIAFILEEIERCEWTPIAELY